MNGEGSISEGKAILSRDQKDPGPARLPRALLRPPQFYEGRGLSVGQVSRRTFIQGLGAIGPAFVAYSLCGRPFSVVPFSVGLRRMKLRRMNFGVAGTTAERAPAFVAYSFCGRPFSVVPFSVGLRRMKLRRMNFGVAGTTAERAVGSIFTNVQRSTYIDELSAEQLTNFVFRYSYLVFRTTKDEQRFTRQADMLKIRLWETKIKDLVISYFVIRISYFERRKTNNASRGRPTC
jgi:hypothetical protein